MNKYQVRKALKKKCEADVKKKSLVELKQAASFIELLLKFKKIEKLRTTFVNGPSKAIDYNGHDKVYSRFNLDGTVTGRLSCQAYGDENDKLGVSFHTLAKSDEDDDNDPFNIRSSYVAPPGYAFITADYSTMELRILAEMAQCFPMLEAFSTGKDLHLETGKLIFQRDEIKKSERSEAKTTNFLIGYGGGPPNLSDVLGIPLSRAEWIVSRWWEVYPEIRQYVDDVEEFIRENAFAQTLFGRRRHLENIHSKDRQVVAGAIRQGVNTTIQSPASDVLVCATVGLFEELEAKGSLSKIIANVHDSMEVISTYNQLQETMERMYFHMVDNPVMRKDMGINLEVPFKVDMEVGFSFGDGVSVSFENGKVTNMEDVWRYLNV